MIVVTLTQAELRFAAMVGVERQLENIAAGRHDRYGDCENGFQAHIDGACGEAAVAKWADRWWSGNLGNLKSPDVGGRVQVRATNRPNGRLILHPDDAGTHCFILVIAQAPNFTLKGWCWGREGKLSKYWADPRGGRPAYFVPQSILREMRTPTRLVALKRAA